MSAVKEPIILQGTVDQLERAWDQVQLLNCVRDRRVNLRLGFLFAVAFGFQTVEGLWKGEARGLFALALLIALSLVCWRRVTGRSALGVIASRRRDRERYRAGGRYDGNTPFRMELAGGTCRIWFRELRDVVDCRQFRNVVESEELIYVSGWRTHGLVLPKARLTAGSPEELRAWLWPYVKKWETIEIPVKLKEAMDKTEKKG